jgi:hypothetical protein
MGMAVSYFIADVQFFNGTKRKVRLWRTQNKMNPSFLFILELTTVQTRLLLKEEYEYVEFFIGRSSQLIAR